MSSPSSGSTFHRSYEERVLGPDHAFASHALYATFLDVLVAHVQAVRALPAATGHADAIDRLLDALLRQHDLAPPEKQPGIPDLYFGLQRRLEADVGGDVLAWLRLGLSRNDLDMTVYLVAARSKVLEVATSLLDLVDRAIALADEHAETVVIARTHHQPAQPITLGHRLAAYVAALLRDAARWWGALERLDRSPLGAAALAGSSHPLDRTAAAHALGFAEATSNTYDAVAAGDLQFEAAATASVTASTLSRITHDLLFEAERGTLVVADGLVQGSSIMPQKRNPVALEHARTRLSRVMGSAQRLAFLQHNIPFGDLNDVGTDAQESWHDTIDDLVAALDLLRAVLETARWNEVQLAEEVARSDVTATELADELVRRAGLGFPEAHAVAAALVARMAAAGRPFLEATPEDLEAAGGPRWDRATLATTVAPQEFVRRRSGLGGPAPVEVRRQLSLASRSVMEYRRRVDGVSQRYETAIRALRTPRKDGST